MSEPKATWEDLTGLADGGLTANQIAGRLNKADLLTRTGKRWYDSTVIMAVRSQLTDADLEKAYPQLAADAKKYDQKQAGKKAKAKKATGAKAAAVDAGPRLPGVVLPKKSPELQAALDRQSERKAPADAAALTADPASVSSTHQYAVTWRTGLCHASVAIADDFAAAVSMLAAGRPADGAVAVPVAELADHLTLWGVTHVRKEGDAS